MEERFENYFIKALHDAKITEISERYQQEGFIAHKNFPINGEQADLLLQHQGSGKSIVFEVKILPLSPDALAKIHDLQQHTEALGYNFRLVTIVRPTRYEIDIDWFNAQLLSYLTDHSPAQIEEKATHVFYEEVDANLESMVIKGTVASVHAVGEISVKLQYGSFSDLAKDHGMVTSYGFPFEGEFELDLLQKTIVNATLHIDDSGWYE